MRTRRSFFRDGCLLKKLMLDSCLHADGTSVECSRDHESLRGTSDAHMKQGTDDSMELLQTGQTRTFERTLIYRMSTREMSALDATVQHILHSYIRFTSLSGFDSNDSRCFSSFSVCSKTPILFFALRSFSCSELEVS